LIRPEVVHFEVTGETDLYSVYGALESTAAPLPDNPLSPYDDLDNLYFSASPKLPELIERYIRGNIKLYKG